MSGQLTRSSNKAVSARTQITRVETQAISYQRVQTTTRSVSSVSYQATRRTVVASSSSSQISVQSRSQAAIRARDEDDD